MLGPLIDLLFEFLEVKLGGQRRNFARWEVALRREGTKLRGKVQVDSEYIPPFLQRVAFSFIDHGVLHLIPMALTGWMAFRGHEESAKSLTGTLFGLLFVALLLAVANPLFAQNDPAHQKQYIRWKQVGFSVVLFERIQHGFPVLLVFACIGCGAFFYAIV